MSLYIKLTKSRNYNSHKLKAKWFTGVRKMSKCNGEQTTKSILCSIKTKSVFGKHVQVGQNGTHRGSALQGTFQISLLMLLGFNPCLLIRASNIHHQTIIKKEFAGLLLQYFLNVIYLLLKKGKSRHLRTQRKMESIHSTNGLPLVTKRNKLLEARSISNTK